MDKSSWEFNNSDFECQLFHAENPKGKFYFRAFPGDKLSFEAVFSDRGSLLPYDTATLSQHTPAWESPASTEIDSIALDAPSALVFRQDIQALLEGTKQSQWVHLALKGKGRAVGYLLPTVRFQQSLTAFNRCREALPAMAFEEARTLSLPFAFGQAALKSHQIDTLADMVSYLQRDKKIIKVLIDAHTDNVGGAIANLHTSRQRAQAVAKQLKALGVASEMIEVRAHGERYPIASNTTQEGQALNRRVTVRLVTNTEQVSPVTPDEQFQSTSKTAKVQ